MGKRAIEGPLTNRESALNSLLPDQAGQGGKVLGTTGTTHGWVSAGAGGVHGNEMHDPDFEPADAAIQTHIAGTGSPHTPAGVGAAAASHEHAGADISSGTVDGDRLPAMSTTKRGGVPATGTPSGKYLKDDGTFDTPAGGSGLTQAQVLMRVSFRG